MSYPVSIPAIYTGYDMGNGPIGSFAFEWAGYQYAFIHQGGVGALGEFGQDYKIHALQSPDKGQTWIELDAANAPLPVNNRSNLVYSIVRDENTVLFVWLRVHPDPVLPHFPIIDGLTVQTFDLTAETWGTSTNYATPVVNFTANSDNIWIGQLIARGHNDYIFYYSGPRETVDGFVYSRAYYATFDGTTFGAGTVLPAQAGHAFNSWPLSACADSHKRTHFLWQAEDTSLGDGVPDYHVGMDSAGSFGTTQRLTSNDTSFAHWPSGASLNIGLSPSQLIVFSTGEPEELGFAAGIYDTGAPDYTSSIRLFRATAALNPVWASAVITSNPALQISPDPSFLTPRAIALACSGGELVCVWSVSNPYPPSVYQFLPESFYDGWVYYWYWTKANTISPAWATPAILGSQPEFPGFHARSTEVVLYPTGGGVGVITVWLDDDFAPDQIAEFFLITTTPEPCELSNATY